MKKKSLFLCAFASALGLCGNLHARSWDFTDGFSQGTIEALLNDSSGCWSVKSNGMLSSDCDNDSLCYYVEDAAGVMDMVSVPETKGLLFMYPQYVYLAYNRPTPCLCLSQSTSSRIQIPNVKGGTEIIIVTNVPDSTSMDFYYDSPNGIRCSSGNATRTGGEETSLVRNENVFVVSGSPDEIQTVSFYAYNSDPLYIYSITVGDSDDLDYVSGHYTETLNELGEMISEIEGMGLEQVAADMWLVADSAAWIDPESIADLNNAIARMERTIKEAAQVKENYDGFAALLQQSESLASLYPSPTLTEALDNANAIYNNAAGASAKDILESYARLSTARNMAIVSQHQLSDYNFDTYYEYENGDYYVDDVYKVAWLRFYQMQEGENDVTIPETIKRNGENYIVVNIDGEYGYPNLFSGNPTSVQLPATLKSIGSRSFNNSTKLQSIEIPELVTSIGDNAFSSCDSLQEVNIRGAVRSIGIYAFQNCDSLRTIQLGDSLRTIGAYAFDGCSSLKDITFPSQLTTISGYAFRECSALESAALPGSLDSIGAYAFYRCSSLKNVTIQEGDWRSLIIGNYAFSDCSALANFEAPGHMAYLGNRVFEDCTALEGIDLQTDGIGTHVFSNCSALKSASIQGPIEYLSDYAFENCRSLAQIQLSDSIRTIAQYAFSGCSALKGITLPYQLGSIEYCAFSSCTSMDSVACPASLDSISTYAFYNCSALKGIYIPGNIQTIGDYTFAGCSSLVNVQLSDSVRSIGRYAFQNCSSLKNLTLPANLQSIGIYAFDGATLSGGLRARSAVPPTLSSSISGLYVVYVPQGAGATYRAATNWSDYIIIEGNGLALDIDVDVPGTLGRKILAETENMEDVNFLTLSGELNDDDIYDIQNRLVNLIEIDMSGVDMTSMPSRMFYQRYALQRIVLPGNLQELGDYALGHCYGITSIELPQNLKSIGNYAFEYDNTLKQVVIPEGVTSMGSHAFWNCTALEKAVLPSSLATIPDGAFHSASSLTDLTLPEGLITIDVSAFTYATKLDTLLLPSTLQTIGGSAFSYCTNLRTVTLPASLTTCGRAFDGTSIIEMTSLALIPPYLPDGNPCYTQDIPLYVPNLSQTDYKLTGGWDEFDIKGIDFLPNDIRVNSDYTLLLPDSLPASFKPNVTLGESVSNYFGESHRASLTVSGTPTLSMKSFRTTYDRASYYGGTDWAFNSLISQAPMRADSVETTLILGGSRWHFLSFPYDVKVSDIMQVSDSASFVIRKYSGAARAAGESDNTWQDMTADSLLRAGIGYIWQNSYDAYSGSGCTFTVPAENGVNKNQIFAHEKRTIALEEHLAEFNHNRSWNLIGNPFPCFYDTRYMEFTAPFTVWDEGNQTYEAYSPVDDEYILRPGEAFFVQRPVEQESIGFPTEGRQTDLTVRTMAYAAPNALNAPRRTQREVFNLYLSDGKRTDRTRFVINPEASTSYDLGTDAGKFESSDKSMAQLYTIEQGVNLSINERPMGTGSIALGAYFGKSGSYTLTLDTRSLTGVQLVDRQEGKTVDLGSGEYSFEAEAGTDNERFYLQLGGTLTGIEAAEASEGNAITATGGAISIEAGSAMDIAVYTVDGKIVARTTGTSARFDVVPGLYIVTVGESRYKVTVNE